MTAMTLTRNLSDFIAGAGSVPAGEEVRYQARRAWADTLGVMLAGRREDAVVKLAQTQHLLAPQAPGDILAWALRAGTAAHSLDYDNVALGGHPGAVLIPALLALARQFAVSGSQLLSAYCVGYEVWGELRRRHRVLGHANGWHPSGLIGPIAAAAASAAVLGLDSIQVRHALAISASQSAGLMVNFGTPVKALHIGFAARAGVFSALLARQGITGNETALEQENGWLATWSPHDPADRSGELAWTRDGWLLVRHPAAVKYYPLCYAAHRIIDAASQLHPALVGRLGDIVRLRIFTSQRHSDILRFRAPADRMQSCFSLEFAAASMLCDGELTLGSLTDAARARPDLRRLMACCERITVPELDPEREGFAVQDRLEVVLSQGTTLASRPVGYARGDTRRPLSDQQVRQKFIACLHWGGVTTGEERLWRQVMNIDALAPGAVFALYDLFDDVACRGCH